MVIHSAGNVVAHLAIIRQLKNLGMPVRGIKDKEHAMAEAFKN
jgi:DNA-binding transcriptional MerR regulator